MDCRAVLAQQGFLNCTTMITVLIEDCKLFHFQCKDCYYKAESVFAMRLVNLRSVTCFYTDQNFKSRAHFAVLNLSSFNILTL